MLLVIRESRIQALREKIATNQECLRKYELNPAAKERFAMSYGMLTRDLVKYEAELAALIGAE